MLEAACVAILVSLLLIWPVVKAHRRQAQRLAAALEAAPDYGRFQAPATPPFSVPRADAEAHPKVQSSLEEAGLALIAVSGRIDVARGEQDLDPESVRSELCAIDAALDNIDSVLRHAATLVGLARLPRAFEDPPLDVPHSIGRELTTLPDGSRSLHDALRTQQLDGRFVQLRVAHERLQDLERFHGELARRVQGY